MAHTFKLKYGTPSSKGYSWSYIDLTDDTHGRYDYFPSTPQDGVEELVESGVWRIQGTSKTDLISKIQAIQNIFRKAANWNLDQVGADQVYLTFQVDGSAETWESQIFEGRMDLPKGIFGQYWEELIVPVTLIWRRAPWWEKYTQLTINNSNGNGASTVIYNQGDSSGTAPTKKENWVNIEAGQVIGDLPAPANIVFSGVGIAQCTGFIAINNARTYPAGATLLEGETGSGDTSDSSRSGGAYHNYTTPAGGTTGVDISKTGSELAGLKTGAWIRFFFSASFTGTIYARPFITVGTKKFYGARSTLTNGGANFYLFDLGIMRFPVADPTGYTGLNSGFENVTIGINLIAATAITVSADYFHYVPTDYFCQAVFEPISLDIVMINSHDKTALANRNYPTANAIGAIGSVFGEIFLEPALDQKLTFKLVDGLYGDVMANYATVEVYAWLRKRTL